MTFKPANGDIAYWRLVYGAVITRQPGDVLTVEELRRILALPEDSSNKPVWDAVSDARPRLKKVGMGLTRGFAGYRVINTRKYEHQPPVAQEGFDSGLRSLIREDPAGLATALSGLLEHALNEVWMAGQDDETCCSHCCAPCAAVKYFVASGMLSTLLDMGGDPMRYAWWDGDAQDVDWSQLPMQDDCEVCRGQK